jgi:ankyrin repeat protein
MGNLGILKALIELGADVHIRDNQDATILCVAAQKGHTDVFRALVECGADVHF